MKTRATQALCSTSVATRMTLPAPPKRAWDALTLYEQIPGEPPFLLRLLLPAPIRVEGRASAVGDEARCLYASGHLTKRITRIERCRRYEFDVIEQTLSIGRGLKLQGGSFTMRELPERRTEVALETRYLSPHRPRWLWRPIESLICHSFHRYIMGAMRSMSASPTPASAGEHTELAEVLVNAAVGRSAPGGDEG